MNLHSKQSLPPNQHVGYLFTVVFLLLAGYGVFFKNWSGLTISILVSAGSITLLITLIKPDLLSIPNRVWYLLGQTLGNLVSPIVLGVIFFLIITPTAFICRAFGRDELRLKRKPTQSYWLIRSPTSPHSQSFRNQF